MDPINQTLTKLGVSYEINSTCRSIYKLNPDGVVVVTSKRAFQNYDADHPERIRCILMKGGNPFLVIVENRELDVELQIKLWLPRTMDVFMGDRDCQICSKKMKPGVGIHICHICTFRTCQKCLNKISIDATAHQCAQCRQWLLSGETFGTPYEKLNVSLSDCMKPSDNIVDLMMSILEKLDGETTVIQRIDSGFIKDHVSLCRISYTDRYFDECMTPAQVRKSLMTFYNKLKKSNNLLRLYILRKTYKICEQENKPIIEATVFQLDQKRNEIYQLPNDGWINVFDSKGYQFTKVELFTPYSFSIPDYVYELFADINKRYAGYAKVASLFGKTRYNINFDISADGSITTLHNCAVRVCIHDVLWKDTTSYVAIRVLNDSKTATLVTYKFDKTGYQRLDPQENKRLFNLNLDGLKHSRVIRKFE